MITSGPYSPGMEVDRFVFISGQGTYDPLTKEKYLGEISLQAEFALQNVKKVIREAGLEKIGRAHV